jgi:hypothetical protein
MSTQPQGRSAAKLWLRGCVVVLVALIVVVACLSASSGGGGGGEGNVAEEPQKEQDSNQAPQQGDELPEPETEPVQEPRPIALSGSGLEATRPFQLEEGFTVIG